MTTPRRRRLLAAAVALTLASLGCTEPSPTTPAESKSTAPPVELTLVDRNEFDQRIAKFKGQVVLVDFWATWCAPCLEQLPHTFALAKDHGDQLAVATVCMDEPDAKDRIARSLAARGAEANGRVLHLLSRDGGGPAAMDAFEVPGGALPYYRVYDKSGKLRHEFALDPLAEKQFTPEDVAAAIDALLAE
jgi:thiol-disulfide isomerase/thioredoxin